MEMDAVLLSLGKEKKQQKQIKSRMILYPAKRAELVYNYHLLSASPISRAGFRVQRGHFYLILRIAVPESLVWSLST